MPVFTFSGKNSSGEKISGERVAANKQVLQPGKALSTTPFPWDRTRSSTTTCTGNRPEVTAGGASYHLAVQVGEAKSTGTKQFVLQ